MSICTTSQIAPATKSTPRQPDQLNNLKTLGAIMRRRRLRLALTLDDLASRTSISDSFLSLIENDRARALEDKLRAIESSLMFHDSELIKLARLAKVPACWRQIILDNVDFTYAGEK